MEYLNEGTAVERGSQINPLCQAGSENSCFSESFTVPWNKAGQKMSFIELRKMHKQGSQSGIALCNTFFTNNYHVELPCKRSDA